MAVTYHLSRTGVDDPGRTGLDAGANAWKTVAYGIGRAEVTHGDTLKLEAGTYDEGVTIDVTKNITIDGQNVAFIQPTGASEGAIALHTGTAGSVTLKDVRVGWSVAPALGTISIQGARNLILNHATVDAATGVDYCILFFTATGSFTSINGSTIGQGTTGAKVSVWYFTPTGTMGNVSVTGGTCGYIYIDTANTVGNILLSSVTMVGVNALKVNNAVTYGTIGIINCNLSALTGAIVNWSSTGHLYGNITLTGNTVPCKNNAGDCFYVQQLCGDVTIEDNTFALGAALTSYGTIMGAGMQPADSPGIIGMVSIKGNVVTNAGVGNLSGAHGVFIGKGVDGAIVGSEAKNNTISGTAFGIVFKDTINGTAVHNECDCGSGFILSGGGNNNHVVEDNILYGSDDTGAGSGGACVISAGLTGTSIQRNKFIIRAGGSYGLWDSDNSLRDGAGNVSDYNEHINNGNDHMAFAGGAARDTLAALQTALGGGKEAHSTFDSIVKAKPSWITSITPVIGSIAAGGTQVLTAVMNTAGLAAGVYHMRVKVVSPVGDEIRDVILTVT